MIASAVEVGGIYSARVSGAIVEVEVLRVVTRTTSSGQRRRHWEVRSLRTGRTLVFRSAQRFRGRAGGGAPTTQTLTAQWSGQPPLTVAVEIPTDALRAFVARRHVSLTAEELADHVARSIDARGTFTAAQRAETLAAAEWIRRENVALFRAVVNGHI